jgi:uncharacterized membrane protein YkgB
LEAIDGAFFRYGLVAILLYYGTFKFTMQEAKAIEPMVANSPAVFSAPCGARDARNF